MSKDISTMFTKKQNKENGRNGYYGAHREKQTVISPSEYGMFLSNKHSKKKF